MSSDPPDRDLRVDPAEQADLPRPRHRRRKGLENSSPVWDLLKRQRFLVFQAPRRYVLGDASRRRKWS